MRYDFLVVWRDRRAGTALGYDLYGTRVSPSGVVREPAGFVVSGATGDEGAPAVVGGPGAEWRVGYDRLDPPLPQQSSSGKPASNPPWPWAAFRCLGPAWVRLGRPAGAPRDPPLPPSSTTPPPRQGSVTPRGGEEVGVFPVHRGRASPPQGRQRPFPRGPRVPGVPGPNTREGRGEGVGVGPGSEPGEFPNHESLYPGGEKTKEGRSKQRRMKWRKRGLRPTRGDDGESACRRGSVHPLRDWVTIHLCGLPGDIDRAGRPPFGLAPGGVCRAARVTPGAGALLPHRFTLTCASPRRAPPSAVCSLWHFPAGHPDWPLASTLPCGAPTFLDTVTRPSSGPTPRPPGRLTVPPIVAGSREGAPAPGGGRGGTSRGGGGGGRPAGGRLDLDRGAPRRPAHEPSSGGDSGRAIAPATTTAKAGGGDAPDRHPSAAPAPRVTGPVAGQSGMASPVDLAAKGYVEDEFFLSGDGERLREGRRLGTRRQVEGDTLAHRRVHDSSAGPPAVDAGEVQRHRGGRVVQRDGWGRRVARLRLHERRAPAQRLHLGGRVRPSGRGRGHGEAEPHTLQGPQPSGRRLRLRHLHPGRAGRAGGRAVRSELWDQGRASPPATRSPRS